MKADPPSRPNESASKSSEAETLGTPLAGGSATQASPTVGPMDHKTLADLLPTQLPVRLGRYELLQQLGKGGMGAVYLARDTQLDRHVALKVPFLSAADGPQVLERFLREARAAANLRHANICPVYDVGEINGIPFLTMAYIDGRTLAERLRGDKKPVPPRTAAAYVRMLALALAEAHHQQVVHRDLKPANIMVTEKGQPIIMDFGLARRGSKQDVRLTQQGTVLGTPAYMAPEQAKGDPAAIGPSCDIYSLGVILYELLTHQLPFTGDTYSLLAQVLTEEPAPPSRHCAAIDKEIEAICLKALAKNPADRYASMTEFAAALGNYLRDSDPTLAVEAPRVPVSSSPLWIWIFALALPVLLLLLVSAGIVLYALFGKGEQAVAPPDNPRDADDGGKDADVAYVWPAAKLRDGKIRAPDLSAVKPLFVDTFGGADRILADGPVQFGSRGYEGGRYRIHAHANSFLAVRIPLAKQEVTLPEDGFACRLVGQVKGELGRWGLRIGVHEENKEAQFLHCSISAVGMLRIQPYPGQGPHLAEPVEGSGPAIKKGSNIANELLLVLRGRHLEAYVNGVAVCNPVLLERTIPAPFLGLLAINVSAKPTTVEFESVTIWPADSIPSLRRRGAIP